MEPTSNRPALTPRTARILDELVVAEGFEQFLQVRYPTAKRFSLEGRRLIPLLDVLIDEAGALGSRKWCSGCRTAVG